MKGAKHTTRPITACSPGDYSDYGGRCIVLEADDRRIAVVLGVDGEAKANATLFTAASDLLEALENIENDDGRIPEPIWKMRNDAIAKAKGEA